MLCHRCNEQEATVHDVSIVKGKVHETHLCESCAEILKADQPKSASLGEWLAGLGMMTADAEKFPKPPKPPAPARATACPACGMRFLDLRKSGLVGCPVCYETFETRLSPLLQKAHDGGARHVGKRPVLITTTEIVRIADAAGGEAAEESPGSVEERIELLTHKLALAIEAENYEKAAEIRDQLAELTGDGGLGGFGPTAGDEGGAA